MNVITRAIGQPGDQLFRVFFLNGDNNTMISPLHDIPLWLNQAESVANMVVEIPKGTHAKMEMTLDEPMNPIKQDTKRGKLRYVNWAYPFNYGAFPQTWENPTFVDENTNAKGDNDPIDVCDISSIQHQTGDVVAVKILGVYAMIDEGETDWKVVVIDVDDPAAESYNDIADVDQSDLDKIFAFLKYYKTPAGSPPNEFGFDEQVKGRDFAVKITEETHEEWKKLNTGAIPSQTDDYNIDCSCASEGPHQVTPEKGFEAISNAFMNYVTSDL
eukprot:TRINITY_DN12124_c0_g1_i1.p1 TRINITY_DN12124_c0_g1~~TRINITY_DN12124_c0_g1_i1.p1  ORF type:complete len:281 (+),score=75.42 TRINITY_DN12124_c0_g1_i1:29-844(+)